VGSPEIFSFIIHAIRAAFLGFFNNAVALSGSLAALYPIQGRARTALLVLQGVGGGGWVYIGVNMSIVVVQDGGR
jgi:hypothetical protein